MTRIRVALGICVLAVGMVGWAYPGTIDLGGALLLLLAGVAHALPVPWARSGWSLRFTLPFLAAIAVSGSPFLAIVADGIFVLFEARGAKRRRALEANLVLSLGSGAIASSAFLVPIGNWGQGVLWAVMHSLANLAFAMVLSSSGRVRLDPISLPFSWVLAALLIPLTFDSEWWLYPLVLGPIWGLRGLCLDRWQTQHQAEETAVLLANLLQRAHPGTHRHLSRVGRLAEKVALRLGLSRAEAERVRQAAILHDIGKIAIDEAILDKPARLTETEYEHVKAHAELGEAILKASPSFAELLPFVRHHHERVDGRGYPDGLPADQIPKGSQIVSVVDAFDAMTGGIDGQDRRPYRPPLSLDAAFEELDRCRGTQFDEQVVGVFRKVLSEELAR